MPHNRWPKARNWRNLGARVNSGLRRRIAVRAELRGRAVHAARRRARAGEGQVQRGAAGRHRPQDGGTLVERDVEVRALAKQVKRLDVADNGLCFGRLDSVSGDRSYIGRIGILDEDNEYEPLLLDWRAPAARAFYVATAATPENMRRRRQFHTPRASGRRFHRRGPRPPRAVANAGDAALLAAVNAPRGEGMRDIVATIQAEQDEIIRLDHPGVLVIEGGPGTGKTVVALHRVAYLLYTQRKRIERHGVLVIGPNPAFLNHIGRVLPSLGESDVVFMTTGDLVPGLRVTAEDTAEAARLKGSLKMLDVLAAAIADRQRLPKDPLPIELADVTVRIDAETAEWASEEARASGLAAQRGPRGVHRDHHVRAHRTGDSPDRPGLADPRRPRRMGAAAGRPARRARGQRRVHRRARRALADPDTGNSCLAQLYSSTGTAARGRRRRGAVSRRRRCLDRVGRAAARRTGRPAGPRQAADDSRRAGTEGGGRVTRPACWTT